MSTRLVLGVVGAVVGFYYGGWTGARWGWAIGYGLGSYIEYKNAPKPVFEGPRLEDLRVTTSTYGAAIPTVYGRARIGSNVIWSSGIREIRREETQGGGKGGSPKVTTVRYDYYADFAVAFCTGPVAAIRKIWFDSILVFDNGGIAQSGVFEPVSKYDASVTLYNGSETQQPDPLIESYKGVGNVSAYRGIAYAVFRNVKLEKFGNRLPAVSAEIIAGVSNVNDNPPVSAAVRDICNRVGLTDGYLDLSEIDGVSLRGYVRSRQMSARSALEPLQRAYQFDLIESDGKLKAVRRGGSSVVTIPTDELAAHPVGQEPPDDVTVTRVQELEMLEKVYVNYVNDSTNYQTATQLAQRSTGNAKAELVVDLPLTLTDQEAAEIANTLLYESWQSRTRYVVSVSYKYAYLDPSDIVKVQSESATHTMRITRINYGDGVLVLEGSAEEPSVYQPVAEGSESQGVPTAATTEVSTSLYNLLDLPPMEDQFANEFGYYATAAPAEPAPKVWDGAVLYVTNDGGASYNGVAAITSATPMGKAATVLGADGLTTVQDFRNSVIVTLDYGELESVSEENLLNGANTALLGDEIIQFQYATQITVDDWELTGLIRGRRGTDWAMGTHQVGERFVLLSGGTREWVPTTSSYIGVTRTYKLQSVGLALDDASSFTFAYKGRNFKPFSPVHVEGRRDPTTKDLTITWIRRTRLASEWVDYFDALLGEDQEKYEVDFIRSGVVVRTKTVYSASVTYTLSERLADGFAADDPVTVKIYQISTIAYRGYEREAVV